MNSTEKLDKNQCRTCYSGTKGLKRLSDTTKCGGGQQMSYAELLANVLNMNIMEYFYNELPQFICDRCQRKLKAAQTFKKKIHEVNRRLTAMLSRQSALEYRYDDEAAESVSRPYVKLKKETSKELSDCLVTGMMERDGKNTMELTTDGIQFENIESIVEDELLVESYPEEPKLESYTENAIELIEYGDAEYEEVIVPHPVVDSSEDIPLSTKKRKQTTKNIIRKIQRESGQRYMSTNNKMIPAKKLKAACIGCCFKCADVFTAKERLNIFKSFWNLTDKDKNCFYNTFVTRVPVKRRKIKSEDCIKQFSYKYYFEKNHSLQRVCRIFFLNTLSINQKRIYYSFSHVTNKKHNSSPQGKRRKK